MNATKQRWMRMASPRLKTTNEARENTALLYNGKSNRIRISDIKFASAEDEQELVLRLDKRELFDNHVLLPHSKVNAIVYEAVNQFVEESAEFTKETSV